MDPLHTAIEHLERAKRVIIVSHFDPDGDAIGSTLGLAWALRAMGKHVTPANDDGAAWPFEFLPGSDGVRADLDGVPADLVVIVDCSDARRGGKVFEQALALGAPVVNIDHHVTNNNFGTVNLVQPDKVAAAAIVFDLLKAMGHTPDLDTATCLLTGITTDTRSFRTSNVDARALRTAAELMDLGAPLARIAQMATERQRLHGLTVMGRALKNVQHEDGVTWSTLPLAAWQAGSNGAGGVSARPRNFSNMLLSVEGTTIGAFFTETEANHVDLSMRSQPGLDLTVLFDEHAPLHAIGGGHPQAAGAEFDGPLEAVVARVVPALKALVQAHTSH